VQPLRELTDQLAKALTERAAREFVHQTTIGPLETTPVTEVIAPLHALVKHLDPARVQAVARNPHPHVDALGGALLGRRPAGGRGTG